MCGLRKPHDACFVSRVRSAHGRGGAWAHISRQQWVVDSGGAERHTLPLPSKATPRVMGGGVMETLGTWQDGAVGRSKLPKAATFETGTKQNRGHSKFN